MNLTEKGGVALHFFASDRSRRNDIDALPSLFLLGIDTVHNRSGEKSGARWVGWVEGD